MGKYYAILPNKEYLEHHGRKDQRWGIRNGPPYPLDRKALSDAGYTKKINKLDRKIERADRMSKAIDAYSKMSTDEKLGKAKGGIQKMQSGVNQLNGIRNKAVRAQREAELDEEVKKMSDNELRQKLNRMNMEQQYKQMSSKDIERGKRTVDNMFSNANTVLTLAGTAVDVAIAAYGFSKLIKGMK